MHERLVPLRPVACRDHCFVLEQPWNVSPDVPELDEDGKEIPRSARPVWSRDQVSAWLCFCVTQ